MPNRRGPRRLSADEIQHPRPIYAVWELTMRCDHACAHCGSRAGAPRADEVDDDTLFRTADRLAEAGTREVTLIGGEAYLHPRFLDIVRRFVGHGVRVSLQTGGMGVTPRMADKMKAAGVASVGVSVDGSAETHDTLRDRPGSHAAALRALENARAAGMFTTANTQVNRLTAPLLRETAATLKAAGARVWRAQLTVPMGRAAERPEWILEPWRIVDVLDALGAIQVEAAEEAAAQGLDPRRMFSVMAGNNLGYYSPHEVILRSRPGAVEEMWRGCHAGRGVLGIESDGTIKACPSLPTAPYVGGNISRDDVVEAYASAPALRFTRDRTADELWGFCATCDYGDICRAGCSFTAHCTLGRRGNNPFCYHRARTLARRGVRERLERVEAPTGAPYDFGRFRVVEEALPVG
jgi:radical SAM protein with 4Fe4S-binding SPASM domain